MINEPEYIVYSLSRPASRFIRLNIIEWKTRNICEYVRTYDVLGHIKRITPNRIRKLGFEGLAARPGRIPWYREDRERVLSNEELYRSATLENIKEVIEELEGAKLHYMYFIYKPLKPLYMSNNCQSGRQARSTKG